VPSAFESVHCSIVPGADKSLARSGRKKFLPSAFESVHCSIVPSADKSFARSGRKKLLLSAFESVHCSIVPSADKSLTRSGWKQARKHVRDARDFNNIETRAVIKFFPTARQGAEGNSRHSDRNIGLFPCYSG